MTPTTTDPQTAAAATFLVTPLDANGLPVTGTEYSGEFPLDPLAGGPVIIQHVAGMTAKERRTLLEDAMATFPGQEYRILPASVARVEVGRMVRRSLGIDHFVLAGAHRLFAEARRQKAESRSVTHRRGQKGRRRL